MTEEAKTHFFEFRIDGHESGRLIVRVQARTHDATDYWDGNWLISAIEIVAGGFTGLYGADLRAEEIKSFRKGLADICDSTQPKSNLRRWKDN